jgi:hypothetical protein
MATLYITVFEGSGNTAQGNPIQYLSAAIGAGSAQSGAITADGRKRKTVRLYADADCWVTWGADPTAGDSTDSIAVGADNPEYWDVESGLLFAAKTRT